MGSMSKKHFLFGASELHGAIVEIVNDYSGGIKFMELVTTLIDRYREHLSRSDKKNLPEVVEKIVRESDDLKVLEYTMKTLNRMKLFVYTP